MELREIAARPSQAAPCFELSCWGDMAITAYPGGEDVRPRSRKARALLAYLALHPGKSVSRTRIATLLWGDRGDEQARSSLRQILFELKLFTQSDPPLLVTDRTSVRLQPEALVTDIERFGTAADNADLAAMARLLPEPDEHLFADLDGISSGFDEWLAIERTRQLDDLVVRASEVARAAFASGETAEARRILAMLRAFDAEGRDPDHRPAKSVPALQAADAQLTTAPPSPQPARGGIDRRMLIGGAAVIASGIGGAILLRDSGIAPQSDADRVYASGSEALQHGDVEQAIAYFREAVTLEPEHANAWGGLALAYVSSFDRTHENTFEQWAVRIRAAANRSHALDPGNADADAAMLMLTPNFRNWRTLEPQYRDAVKRHSTHTPLQSALGYLLCDVGRWSDAVGYFEAIRKRDAFFPFALNCIAPALWGAGRLEEAQQEVERSFRLWPGRSAPWIFRFNFYMLSGQPGKSLSFLEDPDSMPRDIPPIVLATIEAVARALDTGSSDARERAIAANLEARRDRVIGSPFSALYLAALGAVDTAFEILDPYFFGPKLEDGSRNAPPRLARRHTHTLFWDTTAPLRADPRFAELTRSIGLDDYWRQTGTRPDYLVRAGEK